MFNELPGLLTFPFYLCFTIYALLLALLKLIYCPQACDAHIT